MIVAFARFLLPPIWFVLAVFLQILLHFYLPLYRGSFDMLLFVGIAVMLSGMLLILSCARAFRSLATPIKPFSPSTALVRSGAYRFTRNPMYLGMVIMLCGSACALQSLSAGFVIPLFFLLIDFGYVRGEEVFLEEIFGEEYVALKQSVPRWLLL